MLLAIAKPTPSLLRERGGHSATCLPQENHSNSWLMMAG